MSDFDKNMKDAKDVHDRQSDREARESREPKEIRVDVGRDTSVGGRVTGDGVEINIRKDIP